MNKNTIVISSYIDGKAYSNFTDAYKRYSDVDDLTIEITTFGHMNVYAMMIANILSRHKGNVVARIPKCAMSGGNIIALACTELHMTSYATFGSFDSTVSPFALSMNHANNLNIQPEFPILFCSYFKSVHNSTISNIRNILQRRYNEEQLDAIFEVFDRDDVPIYQDELPCFLTIHVFEDSLEDHIEETFKDDTLEDHVCIPSEILTMLNDSMPHETIQNKNLIHDGMNKKNKQIVNKTVQRLSRKR